MYLVLSIVRTSINEALATLDLENLVLDLAFSFVSLRQANQAAA